MLQAAHACEVDVDRGPDWLFVRPRGKTFMGREAELAEQIWGLLEQSTTHRLVLEMDDIELLVSSLIGQLILLQKRIEIQCGMMRVCGLSAANQLALETCSLGGYLPQYQDRTEAVMGGRPNRPR